MIFKHTCKNTCKHSLKCMLVTCNCWILYIKQMPLTLKTFVPPKMMQSNIVRDELCNQRLSCTAFTYSIQVLTLLSITTIWIFDEWENKKNKHGVKWKVALLDSHSEFHAREFARLKPVTSLNDSRFGFSGSLIVRYCMTVLMLDLSNSCLNLWFSSSMWIVREHSSECFLATQKPQTTLSK